MRQIEDKVKDYPSRDNIRVIDVVDVPENKKALLIEVDEEIQKNNEAIKEFCMSIKEKCEADGYMGFAFIKGVPTEGK